MQRMIVTNRALHYGGRSMKPGDAFNATDVDAAYFRNREKAEDAPAEEPKRAQTKPPEIAAKIAAKASEPVAKADAAEEKPTVVPAMSSETASPLMPAATDRYARRDLRANE